MIEILLPRAEQAALKKLIGSTGLPSASRSLSLYSIS